MNLFSNVEIIKEPKSKDKVLFQCDKFYFENYGFYNLISCDNTGHDVHIHLINPDQELLNRIHDTKTTVDVSISTEMLDTTDINFYKLKSYYFCSRYFIANLLFEQKLIDRAYITDADVIFNEYIHINDGVDLGVLYYPNQPTLWKQTGANLLVITERRKDFLEDIIKNYKNKLSEIDFDSISESLEKITRANMYGLDQVCMSMIMQSEDVNAENFLNLLTVENLISKNPASKIWSLTGGSSKSNPNLKLILSDMVLTKYNKRYSI